jgi:multidrug resistance efflux pump
MLGAAALVVAALGLVYFTEQAAYVATDHAVVMGSVVQLGSPTNGQIRSILVDVGDEVMRGQVVATIALASPQNQPQAPVTQASVRASTDGLVMSRLGNPGDSVTAGRPILSIVDPESLWIQAQIDEIQVGRVRTGQAVEVTINALGQVVTGRVAAVGPASASAVAQVQGSSSNSAIRTAQTVPVRIELDNRDIPLVLGSTALVRIRV